MKEFTKSKRITKELVLRKKTIKKEFKRIILKSIIQNRTLKFNIRLVGLVFLAKSLLKNNYITKQNNVCICSGKRKTTFRLTNTSRYIFKQMSDHGHLTNLKR